MRGNSGFEPEAPYQNLPADLWRKRRSWILAIRLLGPYPAPAAFARNIYLNIAATHGSRYLVRCLDRHAGYTAIKRYLAAEKELAPPGAPITIDEISIPAFAKIGRKRKRNSV